MIEQTINILWLVFSVVSCLFLYLLYLCVRNFMRSIADFMAPPGEGEPAPVENLIEHASRVVGKSCAMEIKTTLLGKASGEARLEKAIESDLAQDAIQGSNPLVGSLLELSPSLKKRVLKNPGVIEFLLSHLGSAKSLNRPDNGQGALTKQRFHYE